MSTQEEPQKVAAIPQKGPQVAPQHVSEATSHIADDKERRLAEFVAQMDSSRAAGSDKQSKQAKTANLLTELVQDSEKVEEQIKTGENEIFHKNEEAFFMASGKSYHVKQNQEIQELKLLQEQKIQDIKKRKASKKFQRQTQREIKELYNKTHEQDVAYKITSDVKKSLSDHRERTEMLTAHIEARHIVQIRQFSAAEERRVADTRALLELQCKNLNEEQKSAVVKECNSKLNHRKALDKKRLDHIRDAQRMELRHFKEKTDSETRITEEFSNMRARHVLDENNLSETQRRAYSEEKENILTTRANLKLMEASVENKIQLTRLQANHRIQLRQILRAQKARKAKRLRMWSSVLDRDLTQKQNIGSGSSSQGASTGASSVQGKSQSTSQTQSKATSRRGSDGNISAKMTETAHEDASKIMEDTTAEDAADYAMMNSKDLEKQQEIAQLQLEELHANLKAFQQAHESSLADLKQKQAAESKEKEEEFQKMMMELEWRQDVEKTDLQKSNDAEIAEALVIQGRELEMEGFIREAETKALQERRVLNSLLDSVVDGVISIDPRGFIKRFNFAAEKMFGCSAKDIINRNIKELMPTRFSRDHDDYLFNYLTTGVKKVIGSGRKGYGLRSDKSEFPLYLSVSEVIEDGFHLFTGIVRDLTEEVRLEKLAQAEEDCLPQMIWKIDTNGNAVALNKRFMAYTGVTEDQVRTTNVFDPSVVQPDDAKTSFEIFKKANINKESFESKRRLKGVDGNYKWFLTRGSPIFGNDGKITNWCGSCTDIDETEKLQYELAILPESLPQCLWKINLNGDVLYSNTKFQTYLGLTKDSKGVNVFSPSVVHPDECAKSRAIFDNAVKNKSAFETNRRLKGANGTYNWFMTRGSPILDFDGQVTCFYGTCTDINEAREIQRELMALPESLPICVWKINPRGDVQYANSKFKNYIGAKDGDAMNVFSDKIVHKEDIKQCLTVFLQANKDKKEFETKRRLKGADGTYKKFTTRGVPVINLEGVVTWWYGTCSEVREE